MSNTALTYAKTIRRYEPDSAHQTHYSNCLIHHSMHTTLRAACEEAETVLRGGDHITLMYARTAKAVYRIQLERDGSLSVERV